MSRWNEVSAYDGEIKTGLCKRYAYDPHTFCFPGGEYAQNCFQKYDDECCGNLSICGKISYFLFFKYSAIGCAIFLPLFLIAVVIYALVSKKKRKSGGTESATTPAVSPAVTKTKVSSKSPAVTPATTPATTPAKDQYIYGAP